MFDDVTGPEAVTYTDSDAASDPDDIRDWEGNAAPDQTVDTPPS